MTVDAVSGNGRVAVGSARFRGSVSQGCNLGQTLAFKWTIETGSLSLGDLPGGPILSSATAASFDGSVVVGQGTPADGNEAARWADGTIVGLGDLQGGIPASAATGVSADGSVIIGIGTNFGVEQGFRWEDGMMIGLGNLPDAPMSAMAVSADGRVVAGTRHSQPVRWHDGIIDELGSFPGFLRGCEAYAVSADGLVVVGVCLDRDVAEGSWHEAFRWEAGEMSLLGVLSGEITSYATGVSGDGSIVVGYSGSTVFVWDPINGMRNLRTVLTETHGLNLGGWQLSGAAKVSFDGSMIVGTAIDNGTVRGFLARIDDPLGPDADGDGVQDAVDACDATIPTVPVDDVGCPPPLVVDLDRDGDTDLLDYAILSRCFMGPHAPVDSACLGQ